MNELGFPHDAVIPYLTASLVIGLSGVCDSSYITLSNRAYIIIVHKRHFGGV